MMKFNLVPKTLALALLAVSYDAYAQAQDTTLVNSTSDLSPVMKMSQEDLIHQCAVVANDAARLACFDEVVKGQVPSTMIQKRPLDLGKTVASTLKGEPQLVLAEDERTNANLDGSFDMPYFEFSHTDVVSHDGQKALEKYTPLSLAYDLDKNSENGLWRARPHNPMYILPVFFNAKPNRKVSTPTQELESYSNSDLRATELKMQISFKSKVAEDLFGSNADLWLGYTQQAHWQVYNENNSRPFRALDYKPEIFLTQPVVADLPFGGRLRMLGAGAVHHSNGESDPLSRSWNRAYVMAGMEWGNLTILPRVWTRFAKGNSGKPDDNPDILDYYGYGDVRFMYRFDQGRSISGLARYNPKTNKGALQVDYIHPLGKGISGYVQFFQGYGQSIVDYNHESTAVGIGIMLNDWMGL